MDDFTLVGARPQAAPPQHAKEPWHKELPIVSILLLALIVLGCLLCDVFLTKDSGYMDLRHCSAAPNREFLFGSDTMGRDIFSMIWSGGRLSLFIGICATLLSTAIAVFFGSLSGCAGEKLDAFFMRVNEIFISIPNLLLIVVFVCSFIEGRERGMFYGLVAGLFMDLFYSGPFGFYTLFFINLGYVSGICNKYYYEDYITLPLLLSLASDLIYNLYIYVFRFLIRNRLNFGHYLVSIIIPEIIFTTVTTLVVYRFFLFINRKLKEWEQRRDSNIV